MVYLPAAVFGRPAKTKSWVFRQILAISTDEPTRTGTDPNRSIMTGPYFLDSSWRERWGRDPIRLKFPMIGQGFGPGGRFSLRRRRWVEMRSRAIVTSQAAAYAAQVGVSMVAVVVVELSRENLLIERFDLGVEK